MGGNLINIKKILSSIGNVADEENVDNLYGRSYTVKRHIHGRDRSYPFLGPGIVVTGGAIASTFGAYTEIIPVLANEVNTITLTAGASADGNIVIDLSGKKYVCPVTIGDANAVGAQLRALTYEGDEQGPWTVSGADNVIIFTRAGVATTAELNPLGTGVTATIVKTNTGAGANKPFDIHSIQGGDASAKDTYIIELSTGLAGYEQRIGNKRVTSSGVNSSLGNIPIMTAILPAGTRVVARVATLTGGADTVVLSLNYHLY